MAISAVRGSKLRSILTLLGIAVGVFSIIAVMTAVDGSPERHRRRNVPARRQHVPDAEVPGCHGRQPCHAHEVPEPQEHHRMKQAMAVHEKATLAELVGIEGWRGGRMVVWNGQKTNPNVGVVGENVEGIPTNDWTVSVGRALGQQDMEMASKVAILGNTLAEKLFPQNINPVGESIRVDGIIYKVIGVLQKKGGSLGGNQDNFLIIPLTAFFNVYGKDNTDLHIMVKAKSREVLDDCIEQARMILRTARKVAPGAEDDFGYFSNDSLVTQFNEFTFYLRMGVLLVSSIALLAAGVGIMNIMLVSVTERTREIGIRKSIGAMKRDILTQFMVEAVILCEIGGMIGIVLGILGGNVVGLLVKAPAVIPWDWAGIGIGVCSLVGLIFGVYPAWKASALDPIESLRYE